MATSFAAYASQFLKKQQAADASLSSSQPMFFSFTTDDGSRAGHNVESDLDDIDDPHLRDSAGRSHAAYTAQDDDQDPYLRLDDEEQRLRYDSRPVPQVSSRLHPSGSGRPESPKGWLAHQASPLRSPSTSSSSSDSGPPPDMFASPSQPLRRPSISVAMTESLLPRDGHARPIDVFSLPDPRLVPRTRRKYHDSIWTAIWCTGLTLCISSSILILFLTHKPPKPPRALPYTTLLHTVPLLTILTFLSALVAYTHIFLLRIFVQPVMIATSLFIPATLLVSAIWAFIGSFMWDADKEPTWGETVGLRIFSLIPLVLALITARRLVDLPRNIHMTSAALNLTTRLLLANPFLLALSPVILLAALLASIPFLTLIFRLLLIGYVSHPDGSTSEWHVKAWANWAIAGTVLVWLWSWGVARGVLRVTCAGVIGAWYFADPDLAPPPPISTHTIHAALIRAAFPSLGTVVLSSLILTSIRLLGLFTAFLRIAPYYFPFALRPFLQPLTIGMGMAVGMLEGATTALSKHALVYTGLTGDAFFPSARRARALSAAAEASEEGRYQRKFKREPPLALLTVAPLTLTFPFALTTYLFVAHTLGAPDQALGAAVLAGGVTAIVGLFCVGLVKDTLDTLYMCYCIDKDVGERRREEVFDAFEYENKPRGRSQRPLPSPLDQPQNQLHRAPPTSQPSQQQAKPKSRPEEPALVPVPLMTPRSPPMPPTTAPTRPLHVPARPLPPMRPPVPEREDSDPFVRDLDEDSVAEPHGSGVAGYSLSVEEQDSQIFPGSGLF